MASKGSTESNRETGSCGHYRCVFWALSVSKMHLQSGRHPEPRCRNLQQSPRPTTSLLPPLQNPLLRSRPSTSNFTVPPRQISAYAHGFREQLRVAAEGSISKKRLKNTVLCGTPVSYTHLTLPTKRIV